MNIITKIEIGKRNKERVNIYIDDEFVCSDKTDCFQRYYHIGNVKKGQKVKKKTISKKFLKTVHMKLLLNAKMIKTLKVNFLLKEYLVSQQCQCQLNTLKRSLVWM